MQIEMGRIGYEAAARLTGCDQPWSAANQVKWIAAAIAVSQAQQSTLKRIYLASLSMVA